MQNKTVVSGLVAIAIVVVSWRVHSLRQRFNPGVAAEIREASELPPQPIVATITTPLPDPQTAIPATNPPPLNARLARWRELFPDNALNRDPFLNETLSPPTRK